MVNASVVLTACVLFGTLASASSDKVVLNEDVLMGTCTWTCDTIPDLHNKEGCTKISGCTLGSPGWVRGFVRCDYCKCDCEEDEEDRDVLVEKTKISTDEYELYGRCTGLLFSCSRRGLVRSDFKGCHRVEDCSFAEPDALPDLFACDYCTCQCVNEHYANKYRMTNIKYDIENAHMKKGRPFALNKSTFLKNNGGISQTMTRVLTYTDSQTTAMETSKALQHGLTITVDATIGPFGVGSLGTSVGNQLTKGFTQNAGQTNMTSRSDEIRATVRVEPYSSVNVTVIGFRIEVDVSYTADLVTEYTDGRTDTQQITGIYRNVDSSEAYVEYGEQIPLKKP
ncbi:uncharacterized protein LOC135492890 [Lineus longissimus]|uniref:uncharacterized protein LOC135492890 n=1 Tax=Lineus longissimus TaxID=88925 RepID=UPI00315D9B37